MESQANATEETRNVIKFLRNKAGIKVKVGALNGKRIDYFKGASAINALLSPAYSKLKNVPKVADEKEAEQLLHNIIPYTFFLRVDRGPLAGGKDAIRVLQVNQQQMFRPDLFFAWFYDGSQLGLQLGAAGMVAIMLAGVMFPLWPPTMRLGVWYLSIGVLGLIGLFFVISIVRLVFWLVTVVVARPGIWIFPNLFEDVGFVDSFIPLWAWDASSSKKDKKAKKPKTTRESGRSTALASRQQAIANLPGAPQRASPPKTPEAAAASQPTEAERPRQATLNGGPGAASESLDDIN